MHISVRTIKRGAPSIASWGFKPNLRYVLGESSSFEASAAEISNWIGILNGAEGAGNKDILFTVHNVSVKDFDVKGDNSYDDSSGFSAMASYAPFYPIVVPLAPANYLVNGDAIQGPWNIWPGGQRWALVTKSADFTVLEAMHHIAVNATSAAVAVTLPPVARMGAGREFFLKKVDSSANAVTITPDGAETIEGTGSASLAAQWDSIRLIAYPTGSCWLKG
jgi:hypothetical protein